MNQGKIITVKGRRIGSGMPVFLTAEIGYAHEGNFENAKALMLGAKKAGCDGADMFEAHPYENVWCGEEGRLELQALSFSVAQWKELFAYADEIELILYMTPCDLPSIEVARKVKTPMVNINSDDVNNPVHLKQVASLGIPVTMHDIHISLAEIEAAVETLRDNGCKDIIILHSTLESGEEEMLYATSNLRVMNTYRSAFSNLGVMVGCVEHTSSNFLIYAVAALEPVLISKHILLKHREDVPDNSISVDTENLENMVRNVRYVEMALGNGINQQMVDELDQISDGNCERRKVVVSARDLPANHRIEPGDIAAKRPGNKGGMHPWKMLQLYGAKTKAAIKKDTLLNFNLFTDFPETDYRFPRLEKRKIKGLDTRKGV